MWISQEHTNLVEDELVVELDEGLPSIEVHVVGVDGR